MIAVRNGNGSNANNHVGSNVSIVHMAQKVESQADPTIELFHLFGLRVTRVKIEQKYGGFCSFKIKSNYIVFLLNFWFLFLQMIQTKVHICINMKTVL